MHYTNHSSTYSEPPSPLQLFYNPLCKYLLNIIQPASTLRKHTSPPRLCLSHTVRLYARSTYHKHTLHYYTYICRSTKYHLKNYNVTPLHAFSTVKTRTGTSKKNQLANKNPSFNLEHTYMPYYWSFKTMSSHRYATFLSILIN